MCNVRFYGESHGQPIYILRFPPPGTTGSSRLSRNTAEHLTKTEIPNYTSWSFIGQIKSPAGNVTKDEIPNNTSRSFIKPTSPDLDLGLKSLLSSILLPCIGLIVMYVCM